MADSIKPVNIAEVKKNCVENQPKKAQQEEPSTLSSLWDGFKGYYAEKFEGTEGVGDALKRTWDVCNEGWGQMDDASGLTAAKQKVKDFSKKVDNYVNDGDDTKLSFGEKAWETVKAVGDVADSVVSAKGVSLGCLAAGGGIAAATAAKGGLIAASSSLATAGHTTAAAIIGAAPAVVVDTAVVGGAGTALYGAGEVVLADTKEEVKSGVNKVVTGASIASAGMAMAPGAVEIAQAAGIPVKAGASALANCFAIPKSAVETVLENNLSVPSFTGLGYINPNEIPQVVKNYDPKTGNLVSEEKILNGKLIEQSKYAENGKLSVKTTSDGHHIDRTRYNPTTGKKVSELEISGSSTERILYDSEENMIQHTFQDKLGKWVKVTKCDPDNYGVPVSSMSYKYNPELGKSAVDHSCTYKYEIRFKGDQPSKLISSATYSTGETYTAVFDSSPHYGSSLGGPSGDAAYYFNGCGGDVLFSNEKFQTKILSKLYPECGYEL